MKKKTIISIIIIIMLIVIIAGYILYTKMVEKAKNYEIEEITEYKYFVLKQGDKYGVIDNKANTIIEANYDTIQIPNPEKAVFICYEGENTKVLNEKNEEIYTEFNNIETLELKNVSTNLIYEKSILKYEEDGKYGILSLEGKKITNPIYEEIQTLQYKEGELLVKKDGKYGIINMNGYTIIEPKYDTIKADEYYSSENGYKKDGYIVSITTEEGYRYGYIDDEGKEILEPKYNELNRISYSDENKKYIICAENGKYGLYEENKQIIGNEYQEITYMNGTDFCIVQKGKKYGVITLDGNMILKVRFIQIDVTGNYIYATDENSVVNVYDSKGNKTEIGENTIILNADEEGKYKIYIESIDGKTIYNIYEGENKKTEDKYSYIEYVNETFFIAANQEGKLGVIDKDGQEIVELKYDSIQEIQGSNIIQANETSTATTILYSNKMEKIAEMTNATISKKENYIVIYNNNERRYFDLNGNEKTNKQIFPNNKLFAKQENGKWGFTDKDSNIVVECKYEQVTEFNEYGYAGIKLDGKWGSIDETGKIIVEPQYEIQNIENVDFIGDYYRIVYGYGEFYYTK